MCDISNLENNLKTFNIKEFDKSQVKSSQTIIKCYLNNPRFISVNSEELQTYIFTNIGDKCQISGVNIIKSLTPIYELIDRNNVRFYLDIDFIKASKEEIEKLDIENKIINILKKKLNITDDMIFVASSIRKYKDNGFKYSAHIHVDIYFKSIFDVENYIESIELSKEFGDMNCDLEFDKSVYSKNRLMRVANCGKDQGNSIDKTAKLNIVKFTYNDSCLITSIPEEFNYQEFKKKKIKIPIYEIMNKPATNIQNKPLTIKENYLKTLFKLCPKILDNYSTWIQAIYLILNETHLNYNCAIDISRLSPKFNDNAIDIINNIKIDDSKKLIKLPTLIKWLKDNGISIKTIKDIQIEYYQSKINYNRGIFNDKYSTKTFSGIIKILIEKRLKNKKYPLIKIISHLQKVIGITNRTEKKYYKKELRIDKSQTKDNKLYTEFIEQNCTNFNNSISHYKLAKEKKEKERNNFIKLSAIINDNYESFQYQDFGMFPLLFPHNIVGNQGIINIINLFGGYDAKPVKPNNDLQLSYIEVFKRHIIDIICNGNEKFAKFVLEWFAFVYKFPGFKTKVCLVLRSDKQQAGKGALINFMIDYIYGKPYGFTTSSLSEIIGDFGGYLMDKTFGNFDETKNDSKNNSADKLKKFISDYNCRSNKKYQDTCDDRNNCNIIITSNNINAAPIENGNARYFQLKISDSKVGNSEYFTKLHEAFKNGANSIAFYLNSIEINDIEHFANKMPENSETNAAMSLSSTDYFIESLYNIVDGNIDESLISFDEILSEPNIKFATIYSKYLECHKKTALNTNDFLNKKQFKNFLNDNFLSEINNHRYLLFNLSKESIIKIAQKNKLI